LQAISKETHAATPIQQSHIVSRQLRSISMHELSICTFQIGTPHKTNSGNIFELWQVKVSSAKEQIVLGESH